MNKFNDDVLNKIQGILELAEIPEQKKIYMILDILSHEKESLKYILEMLFMERNENKNIIDSQHLVIKNIFEILYFNKDWTEYKNAILKRIKTFFYAFKERFDDFKFYKIDKNEIEKKDLFLFDNNSENRGKK